MVTKKRLIGRIAALSVATVFAASLVACGSSNGSGTTDAKAGKNILIGMNSGLVPQFQRYAKEFEKTHKGFKITVKAVPDAQPDYIQQLVTQGLSKALPDIIFNYDTLNQTLNANHLLLRHQAVARLWSRRAQGFRLHSGLPRPVQGRRHHHRYSGERGHRRRDHPHCPLREVRCSRADGRLDARKTCTPRRRRSPRSRAERYTASRPRSVTAPRSSPSIPALKAYGSNIYDPDTKKFIFANEGGIKAWTELLLPYTEKFGTPYSLATNSTLFESNQDAMGVGSTAGIAGLRVKMKDAWDVLPHADREWQVGTGGGSYSLSISAKSDNKEGAYQFMAWFYSTTGGMKTAQPDGVIPPTVDGIAHGAWLTEAAPVPPSFVTTIKASVPKAILPNPIPDDVQPKVVPALQTALQQVVLKGMSVKEAYTAAQDELNKLLK